MIMSLISVRGHLGTPEGIFSLKNKKAICWTRSGQVHLLEGTFVISTLPFKMSLIGHSGRSKIFFSKKKHKKEIKSYQNCPASPQVDANFDCPSPLCSWDQEEVKLLKSQLSQLHLLSCHFDRSWDIRNSCRRRQKPY